MNIKTIFSTLICCTVLSLTTACAQGQTTSSKGTTVSSSSPNTLSTKEKSEGWQLLFDGQKMIGWVNVGKDSFPKQGWDAKDGELIVNADKKKRGGDIMTIEEYSDFEFVIDFKLTKAANSGIKYFLTKYEKGGWLGLEYQILDEAHPDATKGRDGNRRVASLYDVLPAPTADATVKPLGEWNTARIVSKGTHVEHWLNGKKVLEFDRSSEQYLNAVKQSKYKDTAPTFGMNKSGHILLQDHEDTLYFRNIKIRKL